MGHYLKKDDTTHQSLINLVKKRVDELDLEIKKCMKNGSYATVRHFEKAKNRNIEILFQLERDKTFGTYHDR